MIEGLPTNRQRCDQFFNDLNKGGMVSFCVLRPGHHGEHASAIPQRLVEEQDESDREFSDFIGGLTQGLPKQGG